MQTQNFFSSDLSVYPSLNVFAIIAILKTINIFFYILFCKIEHVQKQLFIDKAKLQALMKDEMKTKEGGWGREKDMLIERLSQVEEK